MHIWTKGLLFAGAIALLGCETADGNSGGTGGGSIAIDSLPAALTSTMCGAAGKCGSWALHFTTPTGCSATLGSELDSSAEVADVKAGKLLYDGAKASQCLAAMSSMCFNDLDQEPAACREVFSGVLADGAVCDKAKYCKSKYCKRDSGKDCGVCATKVKTGEKCDSNGEGCPTDNWCIEGTCVADGTVAAGGKCSTDRNCLPDHDCDWNVQPSVCKARGAKDATCKTNQDCNSGLVCLLAAIGDKEGKCGPPVALNKACTKIGGQESEPCASGGSCCVPTSWDGKSVPDAKCLPLLKQGDACTSHMQCGVDGECKDGKCAVLPGKVGDSCAAAVVPGTEKRCAFGLQCGAGDKCAVLSKAGEACTSSKHCEKGMQCNGDDKCFAPGSAGAPCDMMKGVWCAGGAQCGSDNKCVAPAVCK